MRAKPLPIIASILILIFSVTCNLWSQKPKRYSSSEILLGLKRLNVVGSALYIAAHPDDENQRVITYMANEKLLRSAYMSLTRGDGGQNLIGPEIRELLGVIRTQELIAARNVDGGRQFFSRANDFGYSKNPEETMKIWDRDQVLSDVVYVFRKFRPDLIITRFPPDDRGGHGHHTTSAIMAKEAFFLAANPNAFPEQLDRVDTWQPQKIFWNTHPWFWSRRGIEFDSAAFIPVDLNLYNPLLGRSYSEISAESRTMHKSQGFGSSGSRGSSMEWFGYLDGEGSMRDIFEGLDFSWNRVDGGKKIIPLVDRAIMDFDPDDPGSTVALLVEIRKALGQLGSEFWKNEKISEVDALIAAASGLYLEAVANDSRATPGEQIELAVEAINRSTANIILADIAYVSVSKDSSIQATLKDNEKVSFKTRIRLSEDVIPSQPYWLREKGTLGMYKVSDPRHLTTPENPAALQVEFGLIVEGERIRFTQPVVFKKNDPVEGEVYRPFVVTPPVHINFEQNVVIFANGEPKEIPVEVIAGKKNVQGILGLDLPDNWGIEPKSFEIELGEKGESRLCQFRIRPPDEQQVAEVKAKFKLKDGNQYSQGLVTINYDHIPYQVLFPEASARLVKLDIVKNGESIGYIMGAGDDIPSSLEQIGYQVDLLTKEDISVEKLRQYDAIILGIRAYNTVDWLKFEQTKLLDYVKEGGTLIVQYNTSHRLVTPNIAPYDLKLSRGRVSDETANMRILKPNHPILNTPNKITAADFEDWVQERGLYFPGEWDENFEAILSSNDPGEDPRDGGLLVAKYGEGHYIYSGYSWFRELPAGVPGAYRIFTNMISVGKEVIE